MTIKFHCFIANSTQVSKVALEEVSSEARKVAVSAGGDTLMHVSTGGGELTRAIPNVRSRCRPG